MLDVVKPKIYLQALYIIRYLDQSGYYHFETILICLILNESFVIVLN